MNKPVKRRTRLFPRTVDELVKQATKPLMDKQGKLYSALLRDWEKIVGSERAAVTRPQRVQFGANDANAVLHLAVRPAAAPELTYVTEQMLEQCARYFGYRAIARIVMHPTHGMFDTEEKIPMPKSPVTQDVPKDMRDVLDRMASYFASAVVKKD